MKKTDQITYLVGLMFCENTLQLLPPYLYHVCIVSMIKILSLMINESLKDNFVLTAMQPYPAHIKTLINFQLFYTETLITLTLGDKCTAFLQNFHFG